MKRYIVNLFLNILRYGFFAFGLFCAVCVVYTEGIEGCFYAAFGFLASIYIYLEQVDRGFIYDPEVKKWL